MCHIYITSVQPTMVYDIVKLRFCTIADVINVLMAHWHIKKAFTNFRSSAHAGWSGYTIGALWRLNALSAWSNHVCIQIKMTDKDIKAQWHFANVWWCDRLLCIQGLKLNPLGSFPISSQVATECSFTVGKTAYHATFYFRPSYP